MAQDWQQALLDDLDSDSDDGLVVVDDADLPVVERIQRVVNQQPAVEYTGQSAVLPLVPLIEEEMAKYKDAQSTQLQELMAAVLSNMAEESAEHRFITALNELLVVVAHEIGLCNQWLRHQYRDTFPELDQLVASPREYAQIALLVGNEVSRVRTMEEELGKLVSREKVLVIMMAGSIHTLPTTELAPGFTEACDQLIQLSEFVGSIGQFIGDRVGKFSPNVTAIVGLITASQLIIALGSLALLALTPSCNLALLGVKQMASTTEAGGADHIRQRGYLYYSPIVHQVPADIKRLVMRIVAGKVVLAARVDILGRGSSDASVGEKFRQDIEAKIEKLQAPPEATPDKALSLPKEFKSKKRGGRKYRKMKERMQLSEVRRAQNIMEFGKAEATVTTALGDEVGLGMLGKLKVTASDATRAKMSKAMMARVNKK